MNFILKDSLKSKAATIDAAVLYCQRVFCSLHSLVFLVFCWDSRLSRLSSHRSGGVWVEFSDPTRKCDFAGLGVSMKLAS